MHITRKIVADFSLAAAAAALIGIAVGGSALAGDSAFGNSEPDAESAADGQQARWHV